ncbi:MAG: phosphoribosyltransferase [Granulosicoccus sp.]
MQNPTDLKAHEFWQRIEPPGTYELQPDRGFQTAYPASFSDGSQLLLPIRERDGGKYALASLIINQANFAVVDALASALADQLIEKQIQLLIGIPTLGLTLAEATARNMGHDRYIALGTSRKFWYDDALSVPMRSVTSPGQQKQLFIDPRLLPLLTNKRIAVVDDVISTGSSMVAALSLMERCGVQPLAIGCAMRQSDVWHDALARTLPGIERCVISPLTSPQLIAHPDGGWMADTRR